MEPWKTNLEPSKLTQNCKGWSWGVQVVTGDSQEEVIIFRDTQTDTSPLYIYHHHRPRHHNRHQHHHHHRHHHRHNCNQYCCRHRHLPFSQRSRDHVIRKGKIQILQSCFQEYMYIHAFSSLIPGPVPKNKWVELWQTRRWVNVNKLVFYQLCCQ